MTSHSIRYVIIAAAMVCGARPAAASPFDFIQLTYDVATGVRLVYGPNGDRSDGLPVTFPLADYLANKAYTSQEVMPATGEKNASYAAYELAGQPRGFGSGEASGSTLEVGVDSRIGQYGTGAAVSRMKLTIKNHFEDRSLDLLEFAFEIPAGLVEYTDFARNFLAQSRVGATIDYRLLSPAGPFGGTWDETTGHLFDYFVDLDQERKLRTSDNATVREIAGQPSYVGYEIDAYRDKLRLPEIPPLGELTLYYDMYAFVTLYRNETLGKAFLGDPMNLFAEGGFSLDNLAGEPVPGPQPVPEPATLSLVGVSLLALSWSGRRRR